MHRFLIPFFKNSNQLPSAKEGFKNSASQQMFGSSFFDRALSFIDYRTRDISTRDLYTLESRINKQVGRLLESDKKSHLYVYQFNFQQKVPPIRSFPPLLLLIFVLFYGPF